jgi:hypothetical protein
LNTFFHHRGHLLMSESSAILEAPATTTSNAPAEPSTVDWRPRRRTQFNDSGPIEVGWDWHGQERLCALQLHLTALGLPPLLHDRRESALAKHRAAFAAALQAHPAFLRAMGLCRQLAAARHARDSAQRRVAELESRRAQLTTGDIPDGLAAKLRKLDAEVERERAALDEATAEVKTLEPVAQKAKVEATAAVLPLYRDVQRQHQAEARERLDRHVANLLRTAGDDFTAMIFALEEFRAALPDVLAREFAARLLGEAEDQTTLATGTTA